MIGLAIAEELQTQGFGVYGENIFWNTSPVLQTGSVTELEGLWVNTTPTATGVNGSYYECDVTISTRYTDPIKQGVVLMYLADFVNTSLVKYCALDLTIGVTCSFPIIRVGECLAGSLSAVDTEGRYVKEVTFPLRYKQPDPLPEIPS